MDAGKSDQESTSVKIPDSFKDHELYKYIGVLADYEGRIPENNDNNNWSVSRISLAAPDLELKSPFALEDERVIAGDKIDVTFVLRNNGNADTSSFQSGIFLSTDQRLGNGDDILLGTETTWFGVKSADFVEETTSVTIPSIIMPVGASAADYYVGIRVDNDGDVIEKSEDNNDCLVKIQILPSIYVSALAGDGAWGGLSTIQYFLDFDTSLYTAERDAFIAAFAAYDQIIGVSFARTLDKTQAQFVEDLDPAGLLPGNILGQQLFPNAAGQSYGSFNTRGSTFWNAASLKPGGAAFLTIMHELGHGLGLGHPHDTGNNTSIFPSVSNEWDRGNVVPGTNRYKPNQTLNTIMSYNNSLQDMPQQWEEVYGFPSTPMALDIAALQAMYGSQNPWQEGASTYTLPGSNSGGTSWSCIWDTGGSDTISYGGHGDCLIDLNSVGLADFPLNGYHVSRVSSVYGGYTIAPGVEIENAATGDGNDSLVGNALVNNLSGGGGNDELSGLGGNDIIDGGTGLDKAVFVDVMASYDVTPGPAVPGKAVTVSHSRGTLYDGIDTLTNVEEVVFADGGFLYLDGRNNNPVAANDQFAVNEEEGWKEFSLLGNDSDYDGDALSISKISPVGFANNYELLAGGVLRFRPRGWDSLGAGQTADVKFEYELRDGRGGAGEGVVTVTINGVNDIPAAMVDSQTRASALG